MAAGSSPHFPLASSSIFFLVLCIHLPPSSSVSFSYNFSDTTAQPGGDEIVRHKDAYFAGPALELTSNSLTAPSTDSKGRVWHARSVPLWNPVTGEVASFTTAFSFNITPTPNNVDNCQYGNFTTGDGMAFFLAAYSSGVVLASANSTDGGNLNLFSPSDHFNATGDSRVVAVEFDTYLNEWDFSNQHVGIDVNSIRSVATTDMKGTNNLTSPVTKAAMVRYDNATKLLTVDLQISNTLYTVSATVDLKQSLPDTVAVGFSAANGYCVELHQLLSWSFNSTLEPPATKPEPSTKLLLLLKVLVPVASVLVVCAAVGLLLWLRKKKRTRNALAYKATNGDSSDWEDEEADFEKGVAGPRRYHYRDLANATGEFAEENMLGQGGFGSVYKGRLPGCDGRGQQVAIKKFSPESSQSRKEFEAEVKIIGRLRHRNLVRLLGWCDSRKGLLLVYELVPEGSLDKHIYDRNRLLTWSERYKVILGLGSALHYLHRDWDQRVVHGDIKPSNIMLDSSYNTKLGDFGLARLGDHGTGPQTTDLVKGTMGYIDPEFVNTHRRSTESDIYSFGIVLLEIVSGRPPLNRLDPSFMLLKWVESLHRRGATLDAADARLRGAAADERQMERALVLGLWCAQRDPGERPSIAEAMQVLQLEDGNLPALSLQMYRRLVTPPGVASAGDRGISGSSFSSGVPSSASPAVSSSMTGSSESSANPPVQLPHSTW